MLEYPPNMSVNAYSEFIRTRPKYKILHLPTGLYWRTTNVEPATELVIDLYNRSFETWLFEISSIYTDYKEGWSSAKHRVAANKEILQHDKFKYIEANYELVRI